MRHDNGDHLSAIKGSIVMVHYQCPDRSTRPVGGRVEPQWMHRLDAGQAADGVEVARFNDRGDAVIDALSAIEDDGVERF